MSQGQGQGQGQLKGQEVTLDLPGTNSTDPVVNTNAFGSSIGVSNTDSIVVDDVDTNAVTGNDTDINEGAIFFKKTDDKMEYALAKKENIKNFDKITPFIKETEEEKTPQEIANKLKGSPIDEKVKIEVVEASIGGSKKRSLKKNKKHHKNTKKHKRTKQRRHKGKNKTLRK